VASKARRWAWEPLHTNRSHCLALEETIPPCGFAVDAGVCEVGVKEIWSLANEYAATPSGTRDVDVVVPIRQSGVYLSIHGNIEFLWNLGIAQRVVAAQAVLIEQIRGSVLIDGQDEIVPSGCWGSSCTKPELTSRSFS